MISATHIVAGYTISRLMNLEAEETTLASVLPDIDVLMDFIYPFAHRGLLHTPLFGLFVAATYSWVIGDRKKMIPVFTGWLTHLGLDIMTSSGIPLFFPFSGSHSLSLTYASDPYWNLSIISVSTGLLIAKTYPESFRSLLRIS